ncbi:MAG: ABC transporter permease [Bryobacteraceae bacterium]|jgi:hypothetical protein
MWGNSLTVETADPGADNWSARYSVGPGFFGQMGMPLIAGREFTARDSEAGAKVAVANETSARKFFGKRNPVGRGFAVGWGA